jgi:hypothetical protein
MMDLNGGSMERSQSRTAHTQGKSVKARLFVDLFQKLINLLPVDKRT